MHARRTPPLQGAVAMAPSPKAPRMSQFVVATCIALRRTGLSPRKIAAHRLVKKRDGKHPAQQSVRSKPPGFAGTRSVQGARETKGVPGGRETRSASRKDVQRARERSGRRRAARTVDNCGRQERRLWKRTQMGAADVSSLGRDHRRRPTSAQGSTWGESEHGLPSTKGRWVASSRVRYGTTVSMGCTATKDASHTGLWPGKTWPGGEGAKVLECLSSGSFWTPFW